MDTTIRFSTDGGSEPEQHVLVLAHTSAGTEIGYLELGPEHQDGRRILDLHVNPQHRRQGTATGMWNHAKSSGLRPVHSSMRTETGELWAQAVGDYFPPSEIIPDGPGR